QPTSTPFPYTTLFRSKGRHTRIETKVANLPEGSAVMLWDLEGAKVTTLMPSRKMYMTMDMKTAAEDLKEMKKSQGKEETEFPKRSEEHTSELQSRFDL